MSEMRRATQCLLSALIACGSIAVSGLWTLAARAAHRWSYDLLLTLLLIFVLSIFLILRGRVTRSFWVIPISGAVGYFGAPLAYIAYFATFESQRLLNDLSNGQVSHFLMVVLFVVPIGSFAWLFGVIAGAAFLLLGRKLQAGSVQPR